MQDGFILLHRKLKDNWIWQNPEYLHWFVAMLFKANFKDNNEFLFNGKLMPIKRGQFVTSYKNLAFEFPNCSIKKIRTFLNLLIKSKIIGVDNVGKGTQISILNYDTYQTLGHDKGTIRARLGHDKGTVRATIERKRKKENNENNENNINGFDFNYLKFISFFNKITGRSFKGDSKSESAFNQRIKKYNKAEFGIALRNAYADEYLKQNPKYLTPEYITRENQIEKWLNVIEGEKPKSEQRKKLVTDVNVNIQNDPNRMKW